ncbi:hypothetical protein J2S25_002426 [Mesobacillus stamsii]|uniref:Uncharacterized protein n=1 Tax=Mesobacillus stamsii TaxID=225347 RepID=A0ABU0FY10_9BACI|nr:hypothetical protein [Mesobacillus stamsii]
MKLSDHLTKEQKHKLNHMQTKKKKPTNTMSRKDWENIMGMNKQVLHKKNGSWKRK